MSVRQSVRLSCRLLQRATLRRYSSHQGAAVVDLRSDVLTQPTKAMKVAMATASYGDDVFREDPKVKELQDRCAEMFGMPAALFVPSGTMGNLISVLCHCKERGSEVLFGHMAHLIIYEQGGIAQLGGVMPRTVPNKPDGTFDLDELETYLRPDDIHCPRTALLTVENTHGNCGGKVLPLDFLKQLRSRADQWGLPVHMDGARVFNAVVAQDVTPREILQHVDTVSVCLSKGIGAPVGSVIAGDHDFIERAIRLRKVLGGGWRKPGPLAAAGIAALEDYRERLTQDHLNAKDFSKGVMSQSSDLVNIDIDGVHTNIVMMDTTKLGMTALELSDRLKQVTEEEEKALGESTKVLSLAFYKYVLRLIVSHNQNAEDVQRAVRKINYVISASRQ